MLKVQHVSDEQQYLQNLGPRAHRAHDPRRAERRERGQPEDRRGAGGGPPARGVGAEEGRGHGAAEAEPAARRAGQDGGAGQVDRERGGHRGRDRARHGRAGAAAAARASSRSCACECDVVLPAEAARLAAEARARGEAAPLVENGKAAAEALRLVAAEWKAAGAERPRGLPAAAAALVRGGGGGAAWRRPRSAS